MRHVTATGRTAIFPSHTEEVFEAWYDGPGVFAGVTFELLESELTADEQERIYGDRAELRAGTQ